MNNINPLKRNKIKPSKSGIVIGESIRYKFLNSLIEKEIGLAFSLMSLKHTIKTNVLRYLNVVSI